MTIDYSTDIGKLRLLIHDINEDEFEYTDEEIACFLVMASENVALGAVMALQGLIAKYSATDGDEYRVDTIQYREGKSKSQHYQALLNTLQKSIDDGTNPLCVGVPKTFGIYRQDRRNNEYRERSGNGDLIPPDTDNYEYDVIDLDYQTGPYYEG